ncbi:ATP-dependent helicase [Quillaja saponaria]|uniref:ATP-dependent helicase n=1 Tax=Quillaja saponaria TaxID=32244 RepID=A0AAD7VKB9_QUISA|nr:ATP-dependent helicase [Quillaja saponaria]
MAEDTEKEIQVRTLTGESFTICISSNSTIEDLKLILKKNFSPAIKSVNFHLFFKGDKMRLQSQISSYYIENGEFLVLVPFVKKQSCQIQKCYQAENSEASSNFPASASTSKIADSAWSDIMDDLSYLREAVASNNDNPDTSKLGTFNVEARKNVECDEQKGLSYHLVLNTLQYPCKDAIGEQNCEVFTKFLESVNCLSDMRRGYCKLFHKASLRRGGMGSDTNGGQSCMCPAWLKTIMKAFAFLNSFSAFLYLQCKKTSTPLLEEALSELGKFGVKLGIRDMEHLSLLCPKLICFASSVVEKTSFGDILLIINCSRNHKDHVEDNHPEARKWVRISKIASTLKKRESLFRTYLWQAFERLLPKVGHDMTVDILLEDLLLSAKNCDSSESENKAKRARRSSTTSRSDSDHICHDSKSLLAVDMVEHLRQGIGSKGQMVHVQDICARKASYVEIPIDLSENMRSALESLGVSNLYSHQADSIHASLSGKNVCVATMTSSGKSLCYNVPVLEVLSENLCSCALYIFPTKALAQDQLRALLSMKKGFNVSLNMGIYDGDTYQTERTWLRDNARLLITNPDMLHISILPHHQQFSRILSNLRFVVIDETHTYKGAFGCHTALILRRLRRLCSHVYGSDPSFVFSTATSANPREHCMELANLSTVELIQNDGSPSARKLFILWNPDLHPQTLSKEAQGDINTDKVSGGNANYSHASPIVDASRLFAEMVQHGLRCLTFCKSRKLCELILCYTREILHETAPHLVDSICAYRGGYVAEERRKIESDFFGGKLCGIAATNALELGIDVGQIDVTLHLGFPGSIASLWQQAGRGGRRDRPSLAVYIAFGGPLDQYFMEHPKSLFGRPIECCHIDSQNKQVLEQHLVCAAQEYPLSLQYDERFFGSGLHTVVTVLKSRGYLSFDPLSDSSARIWNYIGQEKLPSHSVNIRAIETVRYRVVDKQRNEVLEEIEESKAFFQVYEASLKYYTKTRDYTDIDVIGGNMAYPAKISNEIPRTNAQANRCKVTTTWFAFNRIWRGSTQIFDTVELSLPQYSYESQAVWIPVTQSIKAAVIKQRLDFRGGLHAASHAVLNVVPLYMTSYSSSDLAPECPNPHDTRYYPERILLYDQHPGGTGVSVQVQPLFTKLLTAALELLTSCCCSVEVGCPNCIQSFACHEYNEVLHKNAAIMIIKGVLAAENK